MSTCYDRRPTYSVMTVARWLIRSSRIDSLVQTRDALFDTPEILWIVIIL